jgi:mscS mechanosensitive ion channel
MKDYLTLKNFLIIGFFLLLYFLADKAMNRVLKKHNNLTNTFLANAIKVIIVTVGIITLLSQYDAFKDVLKSLLTNSAILVAVVGFTLQNSIKNVIAGTLLLSADTFKVGDRVRIPKEDISGEIEELTLRHAKIKLATSERAIVPNYLLNDAVVINNNLDNDETCYALVIPVPINSDIRRAKEIVESVVDAHPDILKNRDSSVILTNYQLTSIEIHAMIWTKNIDDSFRVLSELRLEIAEEFLEKGITK